MAENEKPSNQNPANPPANPPVVDDDDDELSSNQLKKVTPKQIRVLETRVSATEKENQTLRETIKSYEERFKLLSQTPKGKSMLDQVDEWIFGPKGESK